jgi:cell division transport system ATP-binding protein
MEILRLFEDFNKHGTTVLIATHDLGLVSRMKYRSLTLHDGRMSQDPLAEGVL